MKKTIIILLTVLIVVLGCSKANNGNDRNNKEAKNNEKIEKTDEKLVPKSLPNVVLKTYDGKEVDFKKFEGNVVLVDFWATTCPYCVKEFPGFVKLYEKYKDKGFKIIGISYDKDKNKVDKFLKENGVNFTIVKGTKEAAEKFGGIKGIPTTFIFDKKGNIVQKQVGYTPEFKEKFEKTIKKYLNK